MAEPKTRPTTASVRAFFGTLPDPVRVDCAVLAKLMREATGARALMWGSSIVGYGRYRARYANGGEADWPLTGFSPRARNLTVYVMPGFSEYEDLLRALGKCKTAKSCLYVQKLADVHIPTLRSLIARSVADTRAKYPG